MKLLILYKIANSILNLIAKLTEFFTKILFGLKPNLIDSLRKWTKTPFLCPKVFSEILKNNERSSYFYYGLQNFFLVGVICGVQGEIEILAYI